jgi:transcriptional regulator with XRE-family HTH domain
MPLTQPERDNPLMRRYFQEINLPGAQLAKRCGVSHSQIYMARRRNVGADNAEKISGGVARILKLSEGERLRLKAEIMGHPDNLVRAWLGDSKDAAETLGEEEPIGALVVNPERTLAHRSGARVVRKLEELGAPVEVVEAVRKRVREKPARTGKATYRKRGVEATNERAASLFNLRLFKPRTYEAMRRSGLTRKGLYERAGIGRETLRQALYGRAGRRTAESVVRALGEALGLSEEEREAIREELLNAPKKTF